MKYNSVTNRMLRRHHHEQLQARGRRLCDAHDQRWGRVWRRQGRHAPDIHHCTGADMLATDKIVDPVGMG